MGTAGPCSLGWTREDVDPPGESWTKVSEASIGIFSGRPLGWPKALHGRRFAIENIEHGDQFGNL